LSVLKMSFMIEVVVYLKQEDEMLD
jgi:hypothetical protein